MSYARFGSVGVLGFGPSDVYVFGSVGGWLECCGCVLANGLSAYRMMDMAGANSHFAEHEREGHSCGQPWTDMLAEIQKDAGAIWRGEPFDFEIDNARRHVRGLESPEPAVVRFVLPGGGIAEYDATVMGSYGSDENGGVILDVHTHRTPRISEP